MSWRRFLVLLAGLSPTSRWALQLRVEASGPRVIDDPAAAEAYFRAIN